MGGSFVLCAGKKSESCVGVSPDERRKKSKNKNYKPSFRDIKFKFRDVSNRIYYIEG